MSSVFPANPFVGLRPFRIEEALLFFGRRQQTTDVVERLYRTHFLAVLGSSGCGKSSLVRAGLIPRLMAGFLVDARDRWAFKMMTPGESPLARLAVCFGTTEQRLREEGAFHIIERLHAEPDSSEKNCLVLVDQFEEIFRFAMSADQKDEAADFVSMLLALAEQREFPVFVVITMRSDFLGDCDAFHGLPESLNRSHYLVPRLTRQQRRETIEGPIRLYAQTITPQLVDRLLNDIGEESDQLPVMEHALMRTWEEWQRCGSSGPVDLPHYVAIGGVKQALARDADSALDGLSVADRFLTECIFQALTDTDSSNRQVRRPVRMSELENVTGETRHRIDTVIERFRGGGRSFLVVQDIPDSSDLLIDISHESLIRQWPSLGRWALEEADSKRTYLDLVNAVDRNRALFHDSDLQVALDWCKRRKPTEAWASRYDPRFAEAMAFLEKSREKSVRETNERARQETIKRRWTGAFLAMSVLLFLVIVYSVIQTKREQTEILKEKRASDQRIGKAEEKAETRVKELQTTANEIETNSKALLDAAEINLKKSGDELHQTQLDNRSLLLWSQASENLRETPENFVASGLLAVEALQTDPSNQGQARHVLMDVLRLLPPKATRFEQAHKGGVRAMAVDPSGQLLVTAGADGAVLLWDLTKQLQVRRIEGAAGDPIAISWDRKWIAIASSGNIAVWETSSGSRIAVLPQGNVHMLAFSPDGTRLAVALLGSYNRAGRRLVPPYVEFSTNNWQRRTLDESPPARELAFSRPDTLAMVVEVPNDPKRTAIRLSNRSALVPDSNGCHSLNAGDKGALYASCPGGIVQLNGDSLTRVAPVEFQDVSMNASAGGVTYVGRVPSENTIRVYRPDSGDLFRITEKVTALAVPPVGKWIAMGNSEGTVVFLPLERASVARNINLKRGVNVADVTFSHDEKWLAVAEAAGRVHIFDPSGGAEMKSIDLRAELVRPMFSPDDSILGLLGPSEIHLIQTSDWTPIKREIKGQPGVDVSFTFTADSKMLLMAETGILHRFQISPWNTLPPIQLNRGEDIFISSDKRWISQIPPSAGENVPERFRFWSVESGASVSLDAIPRALGFPRENKDNERNFIPNWIALYPRDATGDADISGDNFGGEWYLGGEIDDVKVKEIASTRLVAELGSGSNRAFSKKGTFIAVVDPGEDETTLWIWPWSLDRLLIRACQLLPRNLSREEWNRFDLPKLGLGPPRATCKNLTFK